MREKREWDRGEEREQINRQRRGAGEHKLKQIADNVWLRVVTVICVSLIIHPCSVWPAHWAPGTWCCLWGWWQCRERLGPCYGAWRKRGGKPHLALCSSGFLEVNLAGSLETPAGHRLTKKGIVRRLHYAAVDALYRNCDKKVQRKGTY